MSLVKIEDIVKSNEDYRKIILTNGQLQLVAMNLEIGDVIPVEVHYSSSQFIKVEEGSIITVIEGSVQRVGQGQSIIIPAGFHHEIAAGQKGAKLYTIYTPPVHTVMGGSSSE